MNTLSSPHRPQEVVDIVQQRRPGFTPQIGLILGSGIGGLADQVEQPTFIDYQELPGFPQPKVQGHRGRLVLGILGGKPVACLQGRVHFYEGNVQNYLRQMVRSLQLMGCHALLVTNAAGSLKPNMPAGSLMMMTDHINYSLPNPLCGANDEAIGPRFTGMDQAYDSSLQQNMRQAADKANILLHEGVYLGCLGPSFETPAEIRAFSRLGADAVGMSTIPEVILARHCGLKVAGVSLITNLAAGMGQELLTHEHTLQQAAKSSAKLQELVVEFLRLSKF